MYCNRDGSVLEERVLGIYYDPNQAAKIALTGKTLELCSLLCVFR